MHKRLQIVVMNLAALATLLSSAVLVCAEDGVVAAGSISVTRNKGRLVFSNEDATPARAPAPVSVPAPSTRRLEYWSNTEHRWKPVPRANPRAMKAAQSAAAEVGEYLSESGSQRSTTESVERTFATQKEIDAAIDDAAKRHNVDPNLVRAVIKVESNFNPHAVSRKGAIGLMQLMPSTARQLKVTNPFDPQQNVDAGVRHLKKLLEDFGGNVKLSLAAYNAGAGAVQRSSGIPNYAETRNYVRRITQLYDSGSPSLYSPLSGPRYSPVRVFRDQQGVLTFTNTD